MILSEDTNMSGFVPLLSAPLNNTFVHSSVDKVRTILIHDVWEGVYRSLQIGWLVCLSVQVCDKNYFLV